MRIISSLIALAFLCSCASTGVPPKQQKEPLSDAEKTYFSSIEAEGRMLYEKDNRAAEATDLLLSNIDAADYPQFAGWVTYPNGSDYTVSFYESEGDGFSVIADVIFAGAEDPALDLTPTRALAPIEISMLNARIAAIKSGASTCSSRHNTVVIPSENDKQWAVYVLAATTDPRLVQIGGHVKVFVRKDNAEVVTVMPLSNSCLTLDKTAGVPEGATLAALTATHVITPMPIAIHPYINLLHDISLALKTENGLWMISDGKVRRL